MNYKLTSGFDKTTAYVETYNEALTVAAMMLAQYGEDTIDIAAKTADGTWKSVAYLKLKEVD